MSAEQKILRLDVAEAGPTGSRIDSYVADVLGLFTRSQVKRRVDEVRLNGKTVRMSKRAHDGDTLEILYSDAPQLTVAPEAIDLEILYEDENVVVVNKPQGMVVHPAAGNWSGTLVNALLYHSGTLAERFPVATPRAGIVHRLDKETSGVIITARSPEAAEFLAEQFRTRKVGKQYLAVVHGKLPRSEGIVETRIARDPGNRKRFASMPEAAGGPPRSGAETRGKVAKSRGKVAETRGKVAVTRYRELRHIEGFSLVSLRPRTGRTHQLRVHMAYLQCPIVGDDVYSRKPSPYRLMLHAYRLHIRLPGEDRPRTFRAPLPERFRSFLRGDGGAG